MGLYDHVFFDDDATNPFDDNTLKGWQTKSLGCQMYNYYIDKDGKLHVESPFPWDTKEKRILTDFEGTINIITFDFNRVWYEADLHFKKGKLESWDIIKPKKKDSWDTKYIITYQATTTFTSNVYEADVEDGWDVTNIDEDDVYSSVKDHLQDEFTRVMTVQVTVEDTEGNIVHTKSFEDGKLCKQ